MTTTLHRVRTVCRAAFITTLLVFLTLAAILVGTQLAGVVLMQPGWVSWASRALLTPSITAAVVFGVVAFISGYFMPKTSHGNES